MHSNTETQQQTRKRRHHTRSRNGCFACKERHVRCDEARPTCANCVLGGRECKYAPPSFPLRDRRLGQPGMPGFMVWQLPSTSSDPFHVPSKMPAKSKELFHYFAASPPTKQWAPTGSKLGLPENIFTPGDPRSDWTVDMSMATQDPTAFRSTMLLAALHHCWKTGSLQDYENTFLRHKGESIRMVNEWLHSSDAAISAACMKLIATLSVTESCIGNFPAADAHLDGMLTLLDMKEAEKSIIGAAPDDEDPNDEILQRLILISHSFSRGINSRIAEGLARQVDLFDIWQRSFSGLAENMTAMRLLPFYFPTGPTLQVAAEIDAEPAIEALRALTENVLALAQSPGAAGRAPYSVYSATHGHAHGHGRGVCDSDDSTACKGCASLSAYFLALTEAHVESLSRRPTDDAEVPVSLRHIPEALTAAANATPLQLPTSWVGLATASEFYLNAALLLWNGGVPEDPRLFRRLLRMLKKDIALSEDAALHRGRSARRNTLWFWKVFMGALAVQSLAESRFMYELTPPAEPIGSSRAGSSSAASSVNGSVAAGPGDGGVPLSDAEWFDARLRRWSDSTGVKDWGAARALLGEIVYPQVGKESHIPSRVWYRATAPVPGLHCPVDPLL